MRVDCFLSCCCSAPVTTASDLAYAFILLAFVLCQFVVGSLIPWVLLDEVGES